MSGFSWRAVNWSSILEKSRCFCWKTQIELNPLIDLIHPSCKEPWESVCRVGSDSPRAWGSPVSTQDQGSFEAGKFSQLWEQKTNRRGKNISTIYYSKLPFFLQKRDYVNQSGALIKLTSFVNFIVCRANSRVGVRMRALAPVLAWGAFSLSNMGTRKAAVLPLPVLAMATTSLPSKITGMVWGNADKKCWVLLRQQCLTNVALVYLSLDWSRNFVTFPHDAFVDWVTKACNRRKECYISRCRQ